MTDDKIGGKNGGLKVDDIVSKAKVGRRTIERELAFLREHGLIRRLEGHHSNDKFGSQEPLK